MIFSVQFLCVCKLMFIYTEKKLNKNILKVNIYLMYMHVIIQKFITEHYVKL